MSIAFTPLPLLPPVHCAQCLYWRAWSVQPAHDPEKQVATYGDCRRHAPHCMKTTPEGLPRTKFPSTAHDDFCGDWEGHHGPRTKDQGPGTTDQGAGTTGHQD